jgi:ribokinase
MLTGSDAAVAVVGGCVSGGVDPVVAWGEGAEPGGGAGPAGGAGDRRWGRGDDGMGREIVEMLTREGVNSRCLQVRDGAATAICVIFVGEDGENAFVWRVGDDVAVTPETVRAVEGALEDADAVLITFEMSAASIREAIGLGRNYGTCVVVQPAPPLDDLDGAASLPWERVNVLVPNENEARALLAARQADGGVPAEELPGALAAELAVPQVIVTLGALGCVVHAHGETRRYAAPKAEAVDTTGASDAFTATYVAQFASGANESQAVSKAQTAAALAIDRRGGYEAMP